MKENLSMFADLAAIMTAFFAGWAYLTFRQRRHRKQRRLEQYLQDQLRSANSKNGKDTGTRSVTHLMARVALTEADVLEAAFASKKIRPLIAEDPETGRAETLLFQFQDLRGRP
jgi:hypothetical protein